MTLEKVPPKIAGFLPTIDWYVQEATPHDSALPGNEG